MGRKILLKSALLLLACVMLASFAPYIALAATTADVVITATPTYIAITNTPASWAAGTLTPGGTTSTANDSYFTANNTGSVTSNITLLVTTANWTGGVGWVHSDTATAGVDQIGLKVGTEGSGTTVVIVKTTSMSLINNLSAANYTRWGATIYSPTSFSDSIQKQVTVRLTIVQA